MVIRVASILVENYSYFSVFCVQRKFICAWDALTKLQHSVAEKKLQLEKEKLDMKLNNILSSQVSSKPFMIQFPCPEIENHK